VCLTSALGGGEWSGSYPGRFTPGKGAPSDPFDRRFGAVAKRKNL